MSTELKFIDSTPYASLSPDLILDAIDSTGFRCSSGLLSLNSYENRVYQIGIEDDVPLIAKFYRPNRWSDVAILEEHAFAQELMELEIPVVAPLSAQGKTLHHYKDFRFALFPRKGGRALELDNMDHLEWMGRFLGRLHAVGMCKTFDNRFRLDVQSYGYQPFKFLMENDFIPAHLKDNYRRAVETVLEKINQKFQQVGPVAYIRLHGDCHAGNVLWNETGPQIVDLDDCMLGPAIQDIWMLLSGTSEQMRVQLDRILDGYYEFCDFNFREVHLIESLRTLRMIMYSGWLARRWEDPAFPLNFPWFNTSYYWQEQLQNINEQITLLNDLY